MSSDRISDGYLAAGRLSQSGKPAQSKLRTVVIARPDFYRTIDEKSRPDDRLAPIGRWMTAPGAVGRRYDGESFEHVIPVLRRSCKNGEAEAE